MRKIAALLCALALPACLEADETAPDTTSTTQHVDAPNAVTVWHANAQTLVGAFTGRGNPAQAYTHALTQIAAYDALVAIRKPHNYKQFIAAFRAPSSANINAAVATAVYRVGITRVNNNPTASATFQAQYDAYIAAIPNSTSKTQGIAAGEQAAQAVLAARANDNFYNTAAFVNPPADPGVWQALPVTTPQSTAGANDYQMAFTVPLTASSPGARRIGPPIALTSAQYAEDFVENRDYGGTVSALRTPPMTDAVQFWTESGFSLWTRNAREIVISKALSEIESARAFAAFGVATADGMLACWDSKYAWLRWRPWQGIPRAAEDGNPGTDPDASWLPLVRANHPEYPAGHGCYGAAATTALRLYFRDDIATTLTSTGSQVVGWPVVPTRSYASLDDIVEDTGNARIWGGLHTRTTMEKTAAWSEDVARDAICGEFGIKCNRGHGGGGHGCD